MQAHIQSPSGNLNKSLEFYLKLNFEQVESEDKIFVTDGKVLIEINDQPFARAGIKVYREEWDTTVAQLKTITHIRKTDEGYLLSDPSNVWIYLVEGTAPITFAQAEKSYATLGAYAGVSLETVDIAKSIKIWSELGFRHENGAVEQGWVEYKNEGGFGISFMNPESCPHLFFNPSLTYFNSGQNIPVIAKIKEAGIPITQEITHFNKEGIVDNVILRDPGGFGFFIFND